MRYAYTISHIPGKYLVAADALSRSPSVRPLTAVESQFAEEVSEQANLVIGQVPATETRLAEISANQQEDELFRQVMTYCLEGWPTFVSLPGTPKLYWQVQNEHGHLLKGMRLVMPSCMRMEMLDKLHCFAEHISAIG